MFNECNFLKCRSLAKVPLCQNVRVILKIFKKISVHCIFHLYDLCIHSRGDRIPKSAHMSIYRINKSLPFYVESTVDIDYFNSTSVSWGPWVRLGKRMTPDVQGRSTMKNQARFCTMTAWVSCWLEKHNSSAFKCGQSKCLLQGSLGGLSDLCLHKI